MPIGGASAREGLPCSLRRRLVFFTFYFFSSGVDNWRTLIKSLALLHGGHRSWTGFVDV